MNQGSTETARIEEPAAPVGRAYWRSLDELAGTPEFRDWVERRFPSSMRELLAGGGVDRRRFLQLMAASIGLAGLSGCRRPELPALPYTRPPEEVVPGLPNYYATAMPRRGGTSPVLVESHEGRPTKIEGNPKHPDSGGATDAIAQASVLDLYDPDRLGPVLRKGQASNWSEFEAFADRHFADLRTAKGRGLRVLAEPGDSPSIDLLRDHLRKTLPEARWHVHDAIGDPNIREGTTLAFGTPMRARPRFDRAEVIVSLDHDFLGVEEDAGRHLIGFAESRRRVPPAGSMSRLYVVEARFSLTGGMADHRLRMPASLIRDYAIELAQAVLTGPATAQPLRQAIEAHSAARENPATARPWIDEVAADLRAHAGRGLIVAGRRQPPIVHALVHAMNAALGNLGETIEFRSAPSATSESGGGLVELAASIRKGEVGTLMILGGNPVHDAPADLDVASLLRKVGTTIRLGLHADETSAASTWHLPAAHYLESWGDARTSDGTVVPIQPLIEPLAGGRTALELIARLSGYDTTVPLDIVRRAYRKVSGVAEPGAEAGWRRFLHDGLLAGSARPTVRPAVKWESIATAVRTEGRAGSPPAADRIELLLDPDAQLDDGRYANNGWLQELPDPVTKLTWGNAASLSPSTAQGFGLANGDVVRLEHGGRSIEIPAVIVPGQADFTVAVPLGHGRTTVGRVGHGVGSNAYVLRTTAAPDLVLGVKVTPTGRNEPLACTQNHFTMHGRDLVREQALNAPRGEVEHEAEPESELQVVSLSTRPAFTGQHQWGMVVDLNTCVGCSACVVACQAENNIPIVGKDQVIRGREMHWIRLDRYYSGDPDDPEMVHQPVACVQCENAPCELVCPVNATVHSEEGLNVQAYGRCIGTRYCANNCPYKTRRFNFYDYNERPLDQLALGPLTERGMAESLKLQKNPDVTIRIRGVMEKCTYCVQRIERAKIGARVAAGGTRNTAVPDGTIVPACAQACPARAIVFGDLSDPNSRVSQAAKDTRNYSLLGELNTRPRTTYLARLRNPNPKMANDRQGTQA